MKKMTLSLLISVILIAVGAAAFFVFRPALLVTKTEKPSRAIPEYLPNPDPAGVSLIRESYGTDGLEVPGLSKEDLKDPAKVARAYVDKYGASFGITDPDKELAMRVSDSRTGEGVGVMFSQMYRGLWVRGSAFTVLVSADGRVFLATGSFVPGLSLDIVPKMTAKQVDSLLEKQYPGSKRSDIGGLQVLVGYGAPRLIRIISVVPPRFSSGYSAIIDVNSGEILAAISDVL